MIQIQQNVEHGGKVMLVNFCKNGRRALQSPALDICGKKAGEEAHAMSGRIPPSEQIRQMMNPFLNQADTSEQPASDFLKLAVQLVARQILEQEVADFVGWEQYERQLEHTGYRNGYKPGRIRSAEGTIPLQVSQMRAALSPYHSRLLEFLRGNTDVLTAG